MYHALLVSEILVRILDYLAEDTVRHPNLKAISARHTTQGCRQALATLASTCRALCDPALDALWRRLHSLEPFVQCLPSRASYLDVKLNGTLPAFDQDEWDVVSRYAPRVQELTLGEPLSLKILESSWFRTTLFLPNLRKLHWIYDDHTVISSIRLLLSPSLVHLHVWFGAGNHTSVLGLLGHYHNLCPNLKSLHFRHSITCPNVSAAFSHAVSQCSDLEALICDHINASALIHVAESRHLKMFSASLRDCQPDDLRKLAGLLTPDHPPFKNVRVLELGIEDLSSVIPYLKSHHQPFEEVSFDFRMLPAPELLYEFFMALSSATRRKTLERIKLFSVAASGDDEALQPVDFHVLSPLMSFSLHAFDVNLHNAISLDDDDVARLAYAWPELETFSFNRRSGWGHLPSLQMPTLRGLVLLLARCPKLHELGMCVDARRIPTMSQDESFVRNTAIKRLSLANSPIQEPVANVAQFLHDHFPSLTAVVGWTVLDQQSPHDRQMWDEVQTQIKEMAFGEHHAQGRERLPVRQCNIQ